MGVSWKTLGGNSNCISGLLGENNQKKSVKVKIYECGTVAKEAFCPALYFKFKVLVTIKYFLAVNTIS